MGATEILWAAAAWADLAVSGERAGSEDQVEEGFAEEAEEEEEDAGGSGGVDSISTVRTDRFTTELVILL